MKRKLTYALMSLLTLLFLTAESCDNSDTVEHRNVERADLNFQITQPPPYFEWSLERYMMTELYNSRNKAVRTYSYVRNLYTGGITSRCPSIGFPLPANTQLTNPLKAVAQGPIAQSEPNGLYTSPSTKGTFIMCVSKSGKITPRYHEQDVEVYTTPMKLVDGELVEVEDSTPTVVIDISPEAMAKARAEAEASYKSRLQKK